MKDLHNYITKREILQWSAGVLKKTGCGRFEKDRGAVKKVPQHSSQCRMSLATKKHKKRLQPFCSIIKLRNKMKTRGSLWTHKERLWIPQIPDNREKECADRAAVSGSGVQSQKAMDEAAKKKA